MAHTPTAWEFREDKRNIWDIDTIIEEYAKLRVKAALEEEKRATGLKDKNGKYLNEGDRVSIPYIDPMGKVTDAFDYPSEIIFKDGCFGHMDELGKIFIPLRTWCKPLSMEYVPNVGEVTHLSDETVVAKYSKF